MKVYYNNKQVEVPDGTSIKSLISQLEDIEHKAVWLNGQHLALDKFDRILQDNDEVRVVRIRGGG